MARMQKNVLSPFANIQKAEDLISPEVVKWFSQLPDYVLDKQVLESTLDVAVVAANTMAEQTFTITGLNTTQAVEVSPPALTSGLFYISARISAANTLAIVFNNTTGSGITEGNAVFLIEVTEK